MKVSVESVSSTQKKVDVVIPAEEVRKTYEEVIAEFQRSAKLKGFRPGRIPRRVVETVFARSIEGEVAQKLVSETLARALSEADLSPVTRPSIVSEELKSTKDFSYTVEFEVVPSFELSPYTGIRLTKDTSSVTEEDVLRVLDELREEHAQAKPLSRPREVGSGDFVVVDYEGVCEGKPLAELTQKGIQLVVGRGKLLPEFEDALVGMSKDEEKEFSVTYPENFRIREAAGKSVIFKIKVVDIMERELPALDDEFAKDLGADSLDALKSRIREHLERDLERRKMGRMRGEIINYLLSRNTFDVPQSLVMAEAARIRRDIAVRLQGLGEAPRFDEKMEEEITKGAEANLRISIILGEIAKREGIVVTEGEVAERLEEIAKSLDMPLSRVKEIYDKNDQYLELRTRLLEDKVIDFLIEKASLEEAPPGEAQIDKEGD
ncbi:MAG: trigger factor [Candidatus Caldarchaeum sp.]